MKKKTFIVFMVILVFNVVTVYAGNAIYGYFQGYSKVKILVNGKEVDSSVPGFIIEDTTVVPLRVVADNLNAVVKWNDDTKTASIIKPNVNMQFTANPLYDRDKNAYVIIGPFGKITKNQRYHFSFHVYSEVDNLPKEKVEVKVVLKDPDGLVVQSGAVQSFDASIENSLQYINMFKDVDFIKTGDYVVELLLKSQSTYNQFIKIGEKLILVN